MTNDEIASLKRWVDLQQQRRIEQGEWPERENLTTSFCNSCLKLFEEVEFRDMMIADLKSESTGVNIGREDAIEWVMKHLQEEMDRANANPEKRTFVLPPDAEVREIRNEPIWEGMASQIEGGIARYEVTMSIVQNDYISIIKRLLEAWRTRES